MENYDLVTNKKNNRSQRDVNMRIQYTLIMLLAIISIYFFFQSPFFEVNKIYVVGTDRLTINQVLDLARIQPGYNILRVKSKQIEERLATHPFIKETQVERQMPSTVKITVIERQETAIVQEEEGFLIIDDTGVVLRKIDNLAEFVLPLITNVILEENLLYGARITNEEIMTGLEIINKLPDVVRERASEISLGTGIRVFFTGGLEIKIGTKENIAGKLQVLADIFTNTDEDVLSKIKYIDLRFNGPPVIKYGE